MGRARAWRGVGLGAERRSGGDQRLHSPTAWLPPGHEPGAGGVAQLPISKRGPFGPEKFWIDDATQWSRQSIGVAARRQARMRSRAITARTVLSLHARHCHGVHATVTVCTLQTRRARFGHGAHGTVTARTLRSRHARFGHGAHASVHGAHASVTARTLLSRRARFCHGVHVSIAVRAARLGRHCGYSEPCGLGGATNTARSAERVAKRPQAGQLRAAQAWRVEPPVAMAISVAQAGDSRAGGTSTARG
jgi:hypothetical protein